MISAFTRDDIEPSADLQPDGWQDIRTYFAFYVEQPFCCPIKDVQDGKLVGIGSVILNAGTCWLAHIIVASQHRRQGLGRRLTRRLVEIGEENGIATQLLIATDMGRPLYAQLGFRESCRYVFFSPHEPPAPTPGEHCRPLTPADHDALLALDRRATGEDPRPMIAAYWRRGWVVDDPDGGRVLGYCLPDLGEGTVVAETNAAGIELLRLRLALNAKKVVVPAGNEAALAFLAGQGSQQESTAARMVRNGPDPVDQSLIFSRVGGHFG